MKSHRNFEKRYRHSQEVRKKMATCTEPGSDDSLKISSSDSDGAFLESLAFYLFGDFVGSEEVFWIFLTLVGSVRVLDSSGSESNLYGGPISLSDNF